MFKIENKCLYLCTIRIHTGGSTLCKYRKLVNIENLFGILVLMLGIYTILIASILPIIYVILLCITALLWAVINS